MVNKYPSHPAFETSSMLKLPYFGENRYKTVMQQVAGIFITGTVTQANCKHLSCKKVVYRFLGFSVPLLATPDDIEKKVCQNSLYYKMQYYKNVASNYSNFL